MSKRGIPFNLSGKGIKTVDVDFREWLGKPLESCNEEEYTERIAKAAAARCDDFRFLGDGRGTEITGFSNFSNPNGYQFTKEQTDTKISYLTENVYTKLDYYWHNAKRVLSQALVMWRYVFALCCAIAISLSEAGPGWHSALGFIAGGLVVLLLGMHEKQGEQGTIAEDSLRVAFTNWRPSEYVKVSLNSSGLS